MKRKCVIVGFGKSVPKMILNVANIHYLPFSFPNTIQVNSNIRETLI